MPKTKKSRKFVKRDRHRLWCFTVNNYTDNDIALVDTALTQYSLDYVGYGKEIGEQGTPHLQGFIYRNSDHAAIDWKTVKAMVPRGAIFKAKGTFQQNKTYCSKGGDYTFFGKEPVGQGKRTDLDAAVEDLKVTPSFPEFVRKNVKASCKYFNNFARVHQYLHRPNYDYQKPVVIVIHGPAGQNKTRRAIEMAKTLKMDIFKKSASTGAWFDRYCEEPYIILDDFRDTHYEYADLLVLLDGYGSVQQVKCATTLVKPKYWIITTDTPPKEWYKNIPEVKKDQIYRRITHTFRSSDTIDIQAIEQWRVQENRSGLENITQPTSVPPQENSVRMVKNSDEKLVQDLCTPL